MNLNVNEDLNQAIARNARDALMEDVGTGDWTAKLVLASAQAKAHIVAKQPAVVCGRPWAEAVMRQLDASARMTWHVDEGHEIAEGQALCHIEAGARELLSAERSMLNFLQMLSSTATMTRRYVQAIADASPNPKGCAILDTRKTLPGLRMAQKYAVRTGGGMNHRMALWHGILIKENHIATAGDIAAAMKAARVLGAGVMIQVEVENLDELQQALAAGARNVLIDDFSLDDMRRAVVLNAGRATLEVSGGVDLSTVRDIAATGVDRISVGKLTKDVQAIDLSMRVIP